MEPKILEKSQKISLYPHRDKRNFIIDFGYRSVAVTFCELLLVRNQVSKFCKHQNLIDMIEGGRVELLSLCNNEYFFLLSYSEVLELQNLINNFLQE